MALVRSGRNVFANNPGIYQGAQSFQSGNYIKGGLYNRNYGAFDTKFSAYPAGSLAPQAFVFPMKDGAIASRSTRLNLELVTATLIPTKPMTASGTLSITVTNAQLDQIVPLLASGSLSITATNAALAASVPITASATLIITSTSANLGGIFPITASASCTLTPSASLEALAFMTAEAGGPTPLSPEGLAEAVWNAVLADYNTVGTTGEALSNASSAGNPWDALLADNNDAGTFGERVQKLLTTSKFLGLK